MTRLISGLALAGIALAAILVLPIGALRLVACGVAVLAAIEYAHLTGLSARLFRWLVPVGAAGVCWWVSMNVPTAIVVVLVAILAWAAVAVLLAGRTMPGLVSGLVGPVYIGVPLGMLVAVHAWGGWRATLLLVAAVVVSDTAQYYSGRAFGRRPLAPTISPNKTMEGALGGAIVGTLFLVLAGRLALPGVSAPGLALLGPGVVVLGICGDLFESRLKRTAGVKDSSALIPGHGGVLDRIDALLFATPAFYFFVRAVA